MFKHNNNNNRHEHYERNQKFYASKEWRNISKYMLYTYPICQICNKNLSTEVHHTLNITDHWHLRLTIDYLQSVCSQCHNRETKKEVRERKNKHIKLNMQHYNDFD